MSDAAVRYEPRNRYPLPDSRASPERVVRITDARVRVSLVDAQPALPVFELHVDRAA